MPPRRSAVASRTARRASVKYRSSDADVPSGSSWAVATSLLAHERGEEAATNPIFFRSELVRDRLAWCHMKVETMRFLGLRILTQYLRDGALGPAASISKLYWSEYHQVVADLAMGLLGASGMVREGRRPYRFFRTDEPGALNSTNSWIDVFLRNARAGTVYAGA